MAVIVNTVVINDRVLLNYIFQQYDGKHLYKTWINHEIHQKPMSKNGKNYLNLGGMKPTKQMGQSIQEWNK